MDLSSIADTTCNDLNEIKGNRMLRVALGLFIVALIAAFFGFGGVSGIAMEGAELFFIGFIILAVLGLIFGGRFFRS